MERLKDTLITTNMRVELLKKDNKKLQHNLTEAKEQIERLEPFEDETYELRAENQQLKMKMEEMDEEMANLKEINEDQRKMNEELTDIASESAAHWSAHESAIDEAAEYIIKMEEEKDLLSKELKQLKERVMAIESNSPCSTLIDSPDKFPSRMYSIDESRPSTSHFDSDYYSQPASPQTKQSRESIDSFSPSERSKKFLDLTEERRRSAKELVHRLSVASLKALRDAPLSPAQQSPHVSTMYQQHIPTIIEDERSETPRNTKRHHKEHQALPPSLLDAAEISPPRPHTVAPHAPAPQQDGLRGLYRPNRSSTSRTSNELRSSSSQISRPTNPATFTDRPHSTIETSHRVSSGGSGNNRNSGSFSDRLSRRFPRHRQSQSDMDLRSGDSTQPIPLALVSPEWDKKAPNASPPISNASEVDLTTEIDPREDKERWWRSMDRLNLSQVITLSQQHLNATQRANPGTANQDGQSSQLDAIDPEFQALRTDNNTIRKPPNAPVPVLDDAPSPMFDDTPYSEFGKDFLFNPNESEEDFMRKARRLGEPKRQA